jgi:uncharacterized protein (TIRG00374 family)
VGIASSLLFLWLVLRQVSWPGVLQALQTADWKLIPLALLLMVGVWGIFAARWQALLGSAAEVRWTDSLAYILIAYLVNTAFPLRLGDLARITLVSRKDRLPIGFTTATVIMEKLFDVLTVVIFGSLTLFVTPVPDVIRRGVQATAITSLVALIGLMWLARSRVLDCVEPLLSRYLPQRLAALFLDLLLKFTQGLQVTKSSRQMLKVGLLSLLSWGVASLSLLCYVRAFHLQVPWQAAVLVLVVTNLGGAIPSSPGAIGVYEFLAMMVLAIWLADQSVTVGLIAAMHAVNLALTLILGLTAAWWEGVSLSALAVPSTLSAANGEADH